MIRALAIALVASAALVGCSKKEVTVPPTETTIITPAPDTTIVTPETTITPAPETMIVTPPAEPETPAVPESSTKK